MKAAIVTAPLLEPVTVQEVKDHLGVTIHDDDQMIAGMISSAREYVEDVTRRKIMTQTWDYYLDKFPKVGYITLPFGNLQSVTYVKYTDSDGSQTTMTVTTEYLVETNGTGLGKVVLPPDVTWPSFVPYSSNPIVVRFICGWTTQALVPYAIKAAIMMNVSDMYENRGERIITVGQGVIENMVSDRLLASHRLWWSL
jgi:uncharacterized phiE125 gp8 family phage protein